MCEIDKLEEVFLRINSSGSDSFIYRWMILIVGFRGSIVT